MPVAELDTAQLSYALRGSGEVVLGIMGWLLDRRFWAAQASAIARNHRFVAFDNRGVGGSRGPAVTTIAEMAADAISLLDHLEVERATLLGVSMGSAVAQLIALDHPDRVRALILGMTWGRPVEYMRRHLDVLRALLEAGGPAAAANASIVSMFTPRFFESGRAAINRMQRSLLAPSAPPAPTRRVLLGQLDAMLGHDELDRLGGVACPTLVFAGRADVMVPFFASQEVAEAIPNAQLEAFETGHGLMVEERNALNARLAEFLKRVRESAR
jgi:pimeloyl-ACP methyl ester carboxylesterase